MKKNIFTTMETKINKWIRLERKGRVYGMLFALLMTAGIALAQTAPTGQFIVCNFSGSKLGTYNNALTAVYHASRTNNTRVKNDAGTTIYECNSSNPNVYWKYQGETFNSSTTSASNASSWVYTYAKAYAYKSDGTIYGVNLEGSKNIEYTHPAMEKSPSYVSKQSVVLPNNFSSMTATLDLSSVKTVQPGSYQTYPGNNLYVYGDLFWED